MDVTLRLMTEVTIHVGAINDLGPTPYGHRRIIPVMGGSLDGPDLKGTILPGGADWQFFRNDGVIYLEAKYWAQITDGPVISITNRGLRHAPDEVMARLNRGEAVDPELVYFRSVPSFEAPLEGGYDWLNNSIFVANLARLPDRVEMSVHQVL